METASGHLSRPVLLVTGASGGIGRAVADLARTGSPDSRWTVVGWDVTRDNNTGTSDISPVDVTDPVAVSDALDAVEDEHGPVASLVHTADSGSVSSMTLLPAVFSFSSLIFFP